MSSHSPRAPAGSPDTFAANQGFYALKLDLTDLTSGKSGFLLFFGQLQGSFSQGNANVTNTFFSPATQSIGLGNNFYTVTMNSYSPPGPPSEGNLGSIGAFVQVQPASEKLPANTDRRRQTVRSGSVKRS